MTTLLELGRQGKPITGIEVIDMHSHIGRAAFTIPDTTAEGIVEVMARTGVAVTVTTAMLPMSEAEYDAANARVLEATHTHAGRILGYYRPFPASPAVSLEEAGRRIDAGFVGLKLHNVNGFPYTHPSYTPYLEAANARRMPVLFHSWGQEEEFKQFRALSEQYPDLSLLLAHTGSNNVTEYERIGRECGNVYLELALSRTPRGLVARLVENVGADKVVWGSDICFISQAHQLGKVLGARMPEEDRAAVLGGNARRILDRVVAAEEPKQKGDF
jgi:uncharacterized protein